MPAQGIPILLNIAGWSIWVPSGSRTHILLIHSQTFRQLNYGHRTQYGRDYITARHERQARRVYQTKRSLRNDPETAPFSATCSFDSTGYLNHVARFCLFCFTIDLCYASAS